MLAVVIALGCAPIAHASPRPTGIVCDMLRKYPGMGPTELRRYAKSVFAAAILLCVAYYFVFLIAIPFSASDQSIGDRGLLALMLLWMTPLTLAGGWYLTLPVILVLGGIFMYAWPRLPSRVTGWRPRGFWQNAAIYPFLLYGLVSAALLILAMFVSIPASCMSGRTG